MPGSIFDAQWEERTAVVLGIDGIELSNTYSNSCNSYRFVYRHEGNDTPWSGRCERLEGHEGEHGENLSLHTYGTPARWTQGTYMRRPGTVGYWFSRNILDGSDGYCNTCSFAYFGESPRALLGTYEDPRDSEGDSPVPIHTGHDSWCQEEAGSNDLSCYECGEHMVTCYHPEMCDCGDGCEEGDCGSCDDYNSDNADDDGYDRDRNGCTCDDCMAMESWTPGVDENYVNGLS